MNKLRDVIYNVSDVILAIIIITLIVGIIGWKIKAISDYPEYAASLPSNSDGSNNPIDNPPDSEDPSDIGSGEETPDTQTPDTQTPPQSETPSQNDEPNNQNPSTNDPVTVPQVVTIKIPDGSIGSSIAKILLENNLIKSSSEFLNRATERKLDSKLRSGTFKIPSSATLDEVINILTGQ